MNAKLDNFSETSKLSSLKNRICGDILSFFQNLILGICTASCPWRNMMEFLPSN